jgi:hypothetical protein
MTEAPRQRRFSFEPDGERLHVARGLSAVAQHEVHAREQACEDQEQHQDDDEFRQHGLRDAGCAAP